VAVCPPRPIPVPDRSDPACSTRESESNGPLDDAAADPSLIISPQTLGLIPSDYWSDFDIELENVWLLAHQDGVFTRSCTEPDLERCTAGGLAERRNRS
jgi:hypothetical protein